MAAPRTERIAPDRIIDTPNGQMYVVSDERMLEATAKATLAQSLVGGGFSVIVDRAPTGVPGEYLTTGAVIQLTAALKAERPVQVAFPEGQPEPEQDFTPAEQALAEEPVPVGVSAEDES